MTLTQAQQEHYRRHGFVTRLPAFDAQETAELRKQVELLETEHAEGAGRHSLNNLFRVNGHLVIPLLAEIARKPLILDQVAGVLGPNLLVWSVELFIKEPQSTAVVSWHQDLTYWGMGETDEELTARVALSDVSEEAGCMRFIPGSLQQRIVDHHDTFDVDNLLSRGQHIKGIEEAEAVHGPLAPGQMSFHHGRCFHASGPNKSNDRRIGCAIRYVTPEVKQSDSGQDYAMLVRGMDHVQGWINVAAPVTLFDPEDVRRYNEILAHQSSTLAAGAENDVKMYAATGTRT